LTEKLRDISVSLQAGVPEWPGDTPFSCGWAGLIADGSSVNVSSITFSPHVGTHADAPLHVRDGWPGSHEIPLEPFYGECTIVDVTHLDHEITLPDLGSLPARVDRLLLKTGRTVAAGVFPESWPALTEDCARDLLGKGLRLLGVDAPSVDPRENKTLPVHNMIFSGNGCILENLDLRRVPAGKYRLIAFPQKLMALDAAPVRAILADLEQL
jgi:arylformamidase